MATHQYAVAQYPHKAFLSQVGMRVFWTLSYGWPFILYLLAATDKSLSDPHDRTSVGSVLSPSHCYDLPFQCVVPAVLGAGARQRGP